MVKSVMEMDTGRTSMVHFIEVTLLRLLTRGLTLCSVRAQGVLRACSDLLSEPKAARARENQFPMY